VKVKRVKEKITLYKKPDFTDATPNDMLYQLYFLSVALDVIEYSLPHDITFSWSSSTAASQDLHLVARLFP
jgi:hypothetical protein